MDEAEFVTAMKELPERYAGRLPEQHLDGVRSMAEGGEWGEEIDNIRASLEQSQQPVTSAERDELAALLDAMGEPTDALDALNVTDG